MAEAPLDLKRARILISNDDGIAAHGIQLLAKIARTLSKDVWIVAPEMEQSAASHSLTVRTPLRIVKRGPRRFAVNGTPTDCVLLAVSQIMADRPPDLVLSGINHGSNTAEDIRHSGTVSAAIQGCTMGIRAIAFSQIFGPGSKPHWSTAEHYAGDLIRKIVSVPWTPDTLINVNFPNRVVKSVTGIEVTRQGRHREAERITEVLDPMGEPYYWIGGPRPDRPTSGNTDFEATARGAVSVTPLKLNTTDNPTMRTLRQVLE